MTKPITVLEWLEKLNKAVDEITPEELIRLVKESGVTEETAKQYANLENFLLELDDQKPITYRVAREGRPDTHCETCNGSGRIDVCGGFPRPCHCTDTPC